MDPVTRGGARLTGDHDDQMLPPPAQIVCQRENSLALPKLPFLADRMADRAHVEL